MNAEKIKLQRLSKSNSMTGELTANMTQQARDCQGLEILLISTVSLQAVQPSKRPTNTT